MKHRRPQECGSRIGPASQRCAQPKPKSSGARRPKSEAAAGNGVEGLSRRRADALDERLADALPDRGRPGERRRDRSTSTATASTISASATPARCSAIRRRPVARAIRRQAGARAHLHAALATTRWSSAGCLPSASACPAWQIATTATDANRFALRVARAVTGRRKILVFNGCYHGAVDETMVRLTGWQTGQPHGPGRRVPRPDRSNRESSSSTTCRHSRRRSAERDVACVITEPVLTNCCMVLPRARLPRRAARA